MSDDHWPRVTERLKQIQKMMVDVNASARTDAEKDAEYPTLQEQVMRIVASNRAILPAGAAAPRVDADRGQMLQAWVALAESVDDPNVIKPSKIGQLVPLIGGGVVCAHAPGKTYLLRDMAVQLVEWLWRRAEQLASGESPSTAFPDPLRFVNSDGKQYIFQRQLLYDLWRVLWPGRRLFKFDDLMKRVPKWKDAPITDEAITQAVKELREFWRGATREDIASKIVVRGKSVGFDFVQSS